MESGRGKSFPTAWNPRKAEVAKSKLREEAQSSSQSKLVADFRTSNPAQSTNFLIAISLGPVLLASRATNHDENNPASPRHLDSVA